MRLLLLLLCGLVAAQDEPLPDEGVPGDGVPDEPAPAPPGAPGGDPEGGIPEDGGDPFVGAPAGEGTLAPPAADEVPAAGSPAAGPPAAGPPIDGAGLGPNFLLAVEDLAGRVGEEPLIAQVGPEGRFPLLDDGAPPDPMADDGIYVAAVSGADKGPTAVTLLLGAQTLASTQVEIPPEMSLPALRVTLTAEGADWQLASDAAIDLGDAAPPAAVAPVVSQSDEDEPWSPPMLLGLGLAPGLLLGLAGGWAAWGRRRRETLLRALSPGHPDPGLRRDGSRVWQVPDPALRRLALGVVARRFAAGGPVLVLPLAGSRPALAQQLQGVAGVSWLEEERPTVPRIQRALDRLSAAGPPAVVVEGASALEAPDPREPDFAVVEELLELVQAPLLLLVTSEDPLPSPAQRALEGVPGGLGEGGELVIALAAPAEP